LEKNSTNTTDFLTTKEIILKELGSISDSDRNGLSLPEIVSEKNEIKITFDIPSFSKEQIFDCIQILKTQIENIRIQTFESGFYSFQSLNENLFDTKNLLDNCRFRFFLSRNSAKIEISKKGNLVPSELMSSILLFKYFSGKETKKNTNPKEILSKLGVTVFDPIEEELKGNTLDFEHIAGYEEVKKEIRDAILYPLQHPEYYDEVSKFTRKFPGRNRPRAILFEGDPGVGKTSMAKVVSCLCKIPMVYVPIESILSKYYGESSQNLAYIFDAAALFPSCLIFLDEIDSLAGNREEGLFEATRKLLSVLLRKLDGFEGRLTSITLGATNRKKDLDPALISRFDKTIFFPLPNLEERALILANYAIQLSLEERFELSSQLDGLSGRNIKDFCDYTERRWTSHLIENKLEMQVPNFSIYLESSKYFKLRNFQ
jgi:AAA+ superfamily predicted ATPase